MLTLAPIRAALDGHPVYVCHISGAWHLGHPQPGKSRDDYRKERL